MHGHSCCKTALDVRSAHNKPKIGTGSFLNMLWVVNDSANDPMRHPVQVHEGKFVSEIRGKGSLEFSLRVLLSELFPQFAA